MSGSNPRRKARFILSGENLELTFGLQADILALCCYNVAYLPRERRSERGDDENDES